MTAWVSGLRDLRGARLVAAVVAGALLIAAGAQAHIESGPVPMTLQTLALLVVGGCLGPRWGAAAAALYVALGILGAPVLADGKALSAMEFFDSKTSGYLAAFPVAAAIAGLAPRHPIALALLFMAAHAVILAAGFLWLSKFIGPGPAWEHGVAPFFLGAAAKSIAAGAVVATLRGRRTVS